MAAAPVKIDARRPALLGSAVRGTRCQAVKPRAGQSHPRTGASGKRATGTPRHRASSAKALVTPTPAALAMATGPASRAYGIHCVVIAPSGGSTSTAAARERGSGSAVSPACHSAARRRGPTSAAATPSKSPSTRRSPPGSRAEGRTDASSPETRPSWPAASLMAPTRRLPGGGVHRCARPFAKGIASSARDASVRIPSSDLHGMVEGRRAG
jgi:hypothetical protein